MIFAERKPFEEIAARVLPFKRILVAGCATCVEECAAGGVKEVEALASQLRMGLPKIQDWDGEVVTVTLEKQCEWEFVEELAETVGNIDVIVSLACGIGVQALAERFQVVPVYPGVNTSALTIREEAGIWASRCAACGDCVLGDTFGLCPVARCAKNILNGPCGGTRKDGKCEIDENIDCVWNLIVERAEARDKLEVITENRKTKDWSASKYGGPKRVVREELRP